MLMIATAEQAGLKKLQLPSATSAIDELLQLPVSHEMAIAEAATSGNAIISCHDNSTRMEPRFFFVWGCTIVDVRAQRRIFHTYVKPMLKMPKDPWNKSPDELLIHVRSGDVWEVARVVGQHYVVQQPPCALYSWVIDGGFEGKRFQHVRIVTEPDRAHPCINVLQKRYPDLVVQSKSVAEDAAAIINARFFIGSSSTFSEYLMMLNENLDTSFVAMMGGKKAVETACGKAGEPREVCLNVPIDDAVNLTDVTTRKEWMVDYDDKQVELFSVCDAQNATL